MSDRVITAVIVGAGFSYAAGFPLTKDLFETQVLPHAMSKAGAEAHQQVLRAYSQWKSKNQGKNGEEWLKFLFENRDLQLATGTKWEDAVAFALARLVKLPSGKNSHYYHGITTSVDSQLHRRFWTFFRGRFAIEYVATTNYDILVEQGLKAEYKKERTAPLCRYGGFPANQYVRKMRDVATFKFEDVKLGTDIVVYKLHGSLNWVNEPHGFKIHDDVRAVFRTRVKSPAGDRATYESAFESRSPAIIPPLPEKQMPQWLFNVWNEAERDLGKSTLWLICGYSMPEYDEALRDLFRRAAQRTTSLKVVLMSPSSQQLIHRWEKICPAGTQFRCLPGLPDALEPSLWADI